MYQSPIEVIRDEISMQFENNIYKAIQSYGVSVDKDELIKALKYDREQYEKGYSDASREIFENIKKIMQHIADEYGRNANQEKNFFIQRELRGSQLGILIALNAIIKYEANLKKKYIGE